MEAAALSPDDASHGYACFDQLLVVRRAPDGHAHRERQVDREVPPVVRPSGLEKQDAGAGVGGIQHGVRKINVDTDCRMAITGAIRKVMMESPEKFDPRDFLKPARAAMEQVCIDRMTAFGQAGHGRKLRELMSATA